MRESEARITQYVAHADIGHLNALFVLLSSLFCSTKCVHLPEVHDDVDTGAAGRLHPRIQTGVLVAMLALLRERIHHVPLPWPGEHLPPSLCDVIIVCDAPDDDNSTE